MNSLFPGIPKQPISTAQTTENKPSNYVSAAPAASSSSTLFTAAIPLQQETSASAVHDAQTVPEKDPIQLTESTSPGEQGRRRDRLPKRSQHSKKPSAGSSYPASLLKKSGSYQ